MRYTGPTFLEMAETLMSQLLGTRVRLSYSPDSDSYITRFEKEAEYRTPAERAIDAAWEINRR